jgi:mannose-6-phosphate isomerase-like protein (cupin superfamily)
MTKTQADGEDLTAGWSQGDRAPGRIDFAVATDKLAPGATTGPRESITERVMMVVDGAARAYVDGEETELSRGSSVLIPAAVPHEIENVGESTLRLITAVSDEQAA